MMLCVTRIIQHHPQARNQTHTHTHTHQANKCRSCWTRHVNIKAKDRDKCKALLHTGLPYPSWNYYCVKPVKHLFIVMSSFCCEAIYIPLENEKCPCNKCLRGQRSYFWMGQIEDWVSEQFSIGALMAYNINSMHHYNKVCFRCIPISGNTHSFRWGCFLRKHVRHPLTNHLLSVTGYHMDFVQGSCRVKDH